MALERRIGLGLPAVLLILAASLSGCVTESGKVYHVGILSGTTPFFPVAEGFKSEMTKLGYIEGENIVYDVKKLNADPEGEKEAARKFVEDGVDLILAFPTDPALAAKEAANGTGIPVVFAQAGIEGNDLIESVREPGTDITGFRAPALENTATRFDFLHELVPEAERIYIIYDPDYPNNGPSLDWMRPEASSLNITLVEEPVSNLDELQAALQARAELEDIGVDAILIMPDIINHSPDGFAAILNFGNEHGLPIGGCMDFMADMGAVFSFFPDNFEIGTKVAVMADKILRGTPAGTIPVGSPENHLRLNYNVTQKLGLDVPEGLMSQTEEIIR